MAEKAGQTWIAKPALGQLAQVSQSLLIHLMNIQVLLCVELPPG